MRKLKNPPKFTSTVQEDHFWQTHDSTDYIRWADAKPATFPHLKPSTKTISLRLPENLLNDIRVLANKEDVPYQSLMKILLMQGVRALRK